MIARVTLEIALRKDFDYLIPEELESRVEVGSRVRVPFGRRQVLGCVTELCERSSQPGLKPIDKVIGAQSLVTPKVLRLARWIADYYCCAPETALKSVLPDSVRKEEEGWKERLYVRLLPDHESAQKLTKRQRQLLDILRPAGGMFLQELIAAASTTPATVRKLEDRGWVEIAPMTQERDPYAHEQILPTRAMTLGGEQAEALRLIQASMNRLSSNETLTKAGAANEPTAFLLHGVTGSGKTEVYLQALEHALTLGKGGIVLVPEISLTPQTVERFKARFCSGDCKTLVAVLHSHLSSGERHDEWHKIRQGRARIAIGARSAIFAPVDPLGLIVVDEEHEHSYKQEEAPRYHARDVAVMRGAMERCAVVLGSATPSLESYRNALENKYRLLTLPFRADDKQMPVVRVIDMRQAMRKDKSAGMFSPQLREAILQRLERREQTMLFLNRRGYATSLQCPECGYVAECPNCSVSLTYHRQNPKLLCHICGYQCEAPKTCPNAACRSPAIRYSGLGTQKVEETLNRLFPKARIVRMDSDALKRKQDYRRILGDFRTGKIDILLGTQMIAKGLHFPNVTLVGIVNADLSLHMPDFRAGERTFQLLTQVAGRSGRGDVEGEVYVQSFTPFHASIQYARRHDFEGFYEQEMEFREELRYPPLTRAALATIKGRSEEKVEFVAKQLFKQLEALKSEFDDLILAGPAPAPLAKAETFYRYQILLRTVRMAKLSRRLADVDRALKPPEGVSLIIDVDPVNLS